MTSRNSAYVPDFEYYSKAYQGTLNPTQFSKASIEAVAEVDARIYPNVVDEVTQDAYKRAVCAICDYVCDESAGIKSWSVGATSEAYTDEAVVTPGRICERHLSGSGLLSRWL